MKNARKLFTAALLASVLMLSFGAVPAAASGNEFDAVCDHLEEHYGAEKVRIPFMWLARFAVGIVRPAGVKSFKVTVYRNLKYSKDSLDGDMRSIMSEAFSDEWSPVLRVVSKDGQQVYLNMREQGKNVKILMVTVENDEAVVVRAKFNPDKLAEFIENPTIFGIKLDGKDDTPQTDPAVQPSALTDPTVNDH